MATEEVVVDYSLENPDTLTKYKNAAQISQKVLKEVAGLCVDGAKVVDICEKGDKILEDEIAKVYKGKKMVKGIGHPATVSPSSYVTPYTPLKSEKEAERTISAGEVVKVQLGAQIDGFGTIVCDNIVVGDKITSREADLLLATHYANELMLRMLLPPGLFATSDEDKKAAASQKPYSQAKMNTMIETIAKTYGTTIVESTTCWQFERNEIEGKKKIILAPSEGVRGEGLPEVGEVWGIEVGLSLGSGKVKTLPERPTLHRRTDTKYGLKRDSSRKLLTEIVKKFGTFPFSLRQLDDERSAKVGVVECVRGGVVRQYDVVVDKDGEPVSRLFSTVALTKNGLTILAAPPALDVSKYEKETDKKITDEEILKILELPLNKKAAKAKK